MKCNKTLPAIVALVMMLATAGASADGQTYDPCDNYYSTFYGIDMKSDERVTHVSDATIVVPQKQQQATSIDDNLFSDPGNYYNW